MLFIRKVNKKGCTVYEDGVLAELFVDGLNLKFKPQPEQNLQHWWCSNQDNDGE